MPLDPDDLAYVRDMQDACARIARYISGQTLATFVADDLVRSAVERQIEIIGEAARHVSDRTKLQHPEIAWRPIVAQRHILAHEYGGVQPELIWRVASVHVPHLRTQLKVIVPEG
ncbi:MAG: DUF86 domain-containing protein [Phycisphaerales bacterium]|jgi:uncharacterized protein with HEPN domain|nr:DUF86 domain-containing protein [Phycisphaerales bacterium]